MEYQLNENGECVLLNVLANAGKSLVGLEVLNSKIIAMNYTDLLELIINTCRIEEKNRLFNSLSKHQAFFPLCGHGSFDKVIVMERSGIPEMRFLKLQQS